MKSIDVSIIIPAKNEGKNIGRCLEALFQQETSYEYEIIVIDSGSTDDTLAVLKTFPAVKIAHIDPAEFGHGKTRNLGAGISKGNYIVFLNADAIPMDKVWLDTLIDPLKENKEIAGVFSRHLPADDCHLYMARDLLKSMPEERMMRSEAGTFDFMLFSTVSAAMPRKIWKKVPFEKDIIIAEDQKWAKSVLSMGLKILYEPRSLVRHSHNYTPAQLMDSKRKIAMASGRFKNKFSALVMGLILVTGGMLVKISGDLLFILFTNPGKITLFRKLKEIKIAIIARIASFWGRYTGWLTNE
ncbi:MAG: glycosyltransferase family 2 protein [bacterium]|nr:glycosyltransferase family 2 protein [bacterium]